jgi:NAD(P)H dehydrogenase (quinone)
MDRVAVIVGHARTCTYCEALGECYVRGAHAGGHQADLFVTSKMDFDPVLHAGFERVQPLEPDLMRAHHAMLAADRLVLIFPLWMGMMPAIFHGFLERVLQPDLLPGARKSKFPKLLKGKSVLIIVTMGMPAFVYRWWFGSYALRALKRNVLGLVGAAPIRFLLLGNVEGVGAAGRTKWLSEVERRGRRAA